MKQRKILVVEDDPVLRELISNVLTMHGYSVESATDGQIGFEKATTADFDLVTMDAKMPNWNGAEAVASLELIKPSLKVLIISGYIGDAEFQVFSQASNILGIISKPFSVENLIQTIEKYFSTL